MVACRHEKCRHVWPNQKNPSRRLFGDLRSTRDCPLATVIGCLPSGEIDLARHSLSTKVNFNGICLMLTNTAAMSCVPNESTAIFGAAVDTLGSTRFRTNHFESGTPTHRPEDYKKGFKPLDLNMDRRKS